eukprot:jgi/Ulvmu1/1259/UM109_0057.1
MCTVILQPSPQLPMMTGNDIEKSQGDSLVRRFCLRLDNGTRIGYSSGTETADKVIKLEFAEGFKEGVVSEEDLYRISDIAGQLDARREAATRPKPVKEPKGPDKKRQRVHKPQADVPDSWIQKGMKVVDVIWNKKLSHIFREPVKPTADFAPDYFNIIKHPMDLGTVRSKLRNGEYVSIEEFEVDVNRIWDNAILYNGSNSDVGKLALELRKSSCAQLQKYGLTAAATEAVVTESAQRNRRMTAGHAPTRWEPPVAEPSERSRSRSHHRPAEPVLIHQESQPDRQEATSARPTDRGKFSSEARTALGSQIENADEATMERVSELVEAHMVKDEDGDPELDMQVLPDSICWQLHDLLYHGEQQPAAFEGPQITGGTGLDEETDDE